MEEVGDGEARETLMGKEVEGRNEMKMYNYRR